MKQIINSRTEELYLQIKQKPKKDTNVINVMM